MPVSSQRCPVTFWWQIIRVQAGDEWPLQVPETPTAFHPHAQQTHDAVICVYDATGNVIETHEHKGLHFLPHRTMWNAMPIPNPTPDSMATSIPIQTWESVALAIPTFGTHDIGLMLISDGRINVSMDSGQTATLFSKTFALIKPMDVIVQAPFNVIFPSDGTCSLTFTLGIKPSTHASLQWAESQYLSFSATPGGLQLPTSIQFTQRALAPGTYTVELQVKAEGNNGYQNQPYPVNVSSGKAAAQFIANEN